MTGHSRFFHTEGMNQGSLSFAGGYGVSGVASVTAAVDAYVGQSSARSGRDVEVSYNVFFSSGFEAIVIAELSMSQSSLPSPGTPGAACSPLSRRTSGCAPRCAPTARRGS